MSTAGVLRPEKKDGLTHTYSLEYGDVYLQVHRKSNSPIMKNHLQVNSPNNNNKQKSKIYKKEDESKVILLSRSGVPARWSCTVKSMVLHMRAAATAAVVY